MSKRRWVSVGEMARALGVSPKAVVSYCDDGFFAGSSRTPGGHRRIPVIFFIEAGGLIDERGRAVVDQIQQIGKIGKIGKIGTQPIDPAKS